MAHIVIVGAGIGGVPCAYEMRKKLGKDHRVTLVGSSPYFEFTPSNPCIAVGWRQREDTRVPMRAPLETKGIQWIEEPVEQIDASASSLRLRGGKVRTGSVTPVYERYVLKLLGIGSLKAKRT